MLNHRRTFHIAAFLMLLALLSYGGVGNATETTVTVASPRNISKLGGNSNTHGHLSLNKLACLATYMDSGAALKDQQLKQPQCPFAASYSTTGPGGPFTRLLLPGLNGSFIFGGGATVFNGTKWLIFGNGGTSMAPFHNQVFMWSSPIVSSFGTPAVIYNAPSGESISALEAANDPNNPLHIAMTFRDEVFSSTPTCTTGATSTIQLLSSTNGGVSWSFPPHVIASACAVTNGLPALASPSVTFDAADDPFFTVIKSFGATESVLVAQGNSALTGVGTPITVDTYNTPGANGILNAFDIADLTPRLAVDRTKGTFGGNVYLMYTIGGMNMPDANSSTGYNVPVVVGKTKNAGASAFGARHRLDGLTTSTKDEYSPNGVVDGNGNEHVFWFDARNDPSGVNYQVFHASSTNGGVSFGPNTAVTSLLLRQVGGDINAGSAGISDFSWTIFNSATLYFLYSGSTVEGKSSETLTTWTSPFPP